MVAIQPPSKPPFIPFPAQRGAPHGPPEPPLVVIPQAVSQSVEPCPTVFRAGSSQHSSEFGVGRHSTLQARQTTIAEGGHKPNRYAQDEQPVRRVCPSLDVLHH